MGRFYFNINGMNKGNGMVCLTCVQLFISVMTDRKDVSSLSYSNIKDIFTLEGDFKDIHKAQKAVEKSVQKVSGELNKEFKLTKIFSETL